MFDRVPRENVVTSIVVLDEPRLTDGPAAFYPPHDQANVAAVVDRKGPGLRIVAPPHGDTSLIGKIIRPGSKRILGDKHFWGTFNQLSTPL